MEKYCIEKIEYINGLSGLPYDIYPAHEFDDKEEALEEFDYQVENKVNENQVVSLYLYDGTDDIKLIKQK